MGTPQKVSFNKDTVSKLAETQKAAEGYFALLATDAEAHEPKDPDNHNVMSKITWRMLKDAEDANSVTGLPIREWITWPLVNGDVVDHEPPSYSADGSVGLLSALFPKEVNDLPRRSGNQLIYAGEEIASEDEQASREEAIGTAGPKAAEVFNDHSLLVGHVVFASLSYSPKSPDFPKLTNKSAEAEAELSDVYLMTSGGGAVESKRGGGSKSKGGKKKGKSSRRRR